MAPTVNDIILDLTTLPPDVNPFDWLSNFLQLMFVPQYPKPVRVQLYAIISLHGLCALILIVSLVLRYRKGQFWLFRWQLSRTLIEPNLATVPACAGIVEIALFEVLLIGVVQVMKGRIPPSYGYSILLAGVLPAIVGEFVTWSIAAGFILHYHKTVGSTPNVRRWSILCNLFGLSIPIVHFGSFLPINILVGRGYTTAVSSYDEIKRYLDFEASKWTPSPTSTSSFDLSTLFPLISIFNNLAETFKRLTALWRIAYIFHAISAILLILALGSIATCYLISVGRVIQRAKQEVAESGRGREMLSRVQQTWTLLVVVLSMFLLLASFSLCLSLYAATHPLETPRGYVFTSFWSSAILTTICSSLLLLQTWVSSSSSSGGSPEREGGGQGDGEEKYRGEPEEGVRTVGFVVGTTIGRSGQSSQRWTHWSDWFGKSRTTRGRPQDLNVSRGGVGTRSRGGVGAGSISVMVEILSRVDSIEEEEGGEVGEFGEELKPRWPPALEARVRR